MKTARHQTTFKRVEPLLRAAAETLIVPRWRRLQQAEITEKSGGEWVTIVDREVEEQVTAGLLELIPEATVVGEEQCAVEPQRLERVGEGLVWLVDPLDGTNNFIAGRPPISLMVALLQDGETVASWMLDPLTQTMHRAMKDDGAWCNDVRVSVADDPSTPLRRGIVKTRFLPDTLKAHVALSAPRIDIQPGSHCAGADYPDMVNGASDFALYWRTLPWDHAPGVLFVTEAGGHAARPDGSAYRAGDPRDGLLVARSRLLWDQARAVCMPA